MFKLTNEITYGNNNGAKEKKRRVDLERKNERKQEENKRKTDRKRKEGIVGEEKEVDRMG